MIKGSQANLKNGTFLEASVRQVLERLAPGYSLPEPLLFRPQLVPEFGVRYETNINFDEVTRIVHENAALKDSPINTALLLASIMAVEPGIIIASRNASEIAVDPIKSAIISNRFSDLIKRSSLNKEQLEAFNDVLVSESHCVAEAVNGGVRTFRDVVKLVQEAEKFKSWVHGIEEDSQLRDEYCKAVGSVDWADKLPQKSLRFTLMTGLGVLAGVLLTPTGGVAVGVALSAADYFLLDKLVKGWKPNQFVQNSLKPFVKQ
jgi:hypothetical protein